MCTWDINNFPVPYVVNTFLSMECLSFTLVYNIRLPKGSCKHLEEFVEENREFK